MYSISKEFHFSAAHQLHGLPDEHPCSRLHGHNYKVAVVLAAARLDARGFVADYGDLAPLGQYIDEALDHRNLNDVLPVQTSAENLAKHLFDFCAGQGWPVVAVHVSETPRTWATYREVEWRP